MNREVLPGHDNARVPGHPNTSVDDVDIGEIREPVEEPTRLEKRPIEQLQGLYQAAVKVQPAPADQGIGKVLGDREFGENEVEEAVGEEGGRIRCGRVYNKSGEIGCFGRRRWRWGR